MSGEIVNRVEKSGLLTIDLDEIKLPNNIFEIDIKTDAEYILPIDDDAFSPGAILFSINSLYIFDL